MFGLGLTLLVPRARAEESQGERLFREGRELMLEGNFAEACPKLEESQRLEPHTGTLLNVAACHERSGKTASAWVEYQKAATAARAEGQTDRVRFAEARIKVLDPRVPWLTIAVPPTGAPREGVSVTLDGASIQPVEWGKELPVDPGEHVVNVKAPGEKEFRTRFTLSEGEHKTVTVPASDQAAPVPSPNKPTTLVVQPTKRRTPPPSRQHVAVATPPPKPGRFVVELGLFVGLLATSHVKYAQLDDPGAIDLESTTTPATTTSCASVSCDASLDPADGAIGGVNVFGGYAFSEHITAGARFVGGPSLSRSGGHFVAGGPSLLIEAGGRLRFGGTLLFGEASVGGTGTVAQPAGYSAWPTSAEMHATVGGALGAALEFEWDMLRLERGALALETSPAFLVGENGAAWTLPLGVMYRFR